MIQTAFVARMARYNRWQNRNLYGAASILGEEARRLDRGAFFRSIHETLSHLVWGDSVWLHRFDGTPKPPGGIAESARLHADWDDLTAAREKLDAAILDWSARVKQDWLDDELRWVSGVTGKAMSAPVGMTVTHFFNHQTHHRGQVHAMLTAAGARPGDTDLFLMPDDA